MSQHDNESPGSATTTKADIAAELYEKVGGFSKRESADLVDRTFEILKDALGAGEKVKISGFGNFSVRFKKPRVGRNPLTGTEIEITARHVATFKASPVLKSQVNGGDGSDVTDEES
ncbi:MAG: integration host factor subunit alpha [Myxococcales bacterium]|jgi:integration host factor subunit alpha|nr:integration host factor subunit alpha [Myxococcales bacterium]